MFPAPESEDLHGGCPVSRTRRSAQGGRRSRQEHVADIEASEGAAGNISVCLRWPVEPRTRFPVVDRLELPQAVPELAGASLLVTGSGASPARDRRRPRCEPRLSRRRGGGRTARMHTSHHRRFERVTSEFSSAPRRARRPDPRHRHELSRGDPRPADLPDLPEPHAALPGRDVPQHASAPLAARDDRQPARRHRRRPVPRAGISGPHGCHHRVVAAASDRVVVEARCDGPFGPCPSSARPIGWNTPRPQRSTSTWTCVPESVASD